MITINISKKIGYAFVVLLAVLIFVIAGTTLGQAADPPPEVQPAEQTMDQTEEDRDVEYVL